MTFNMYTVIKDLIDICEKHKEIEKKKKISRLIENIGYCAPEIRESRFWSGNKNWYGLIKILNKNCDNISDCNIEINKYFKSMIVKYKENKGFDV